MNVALLPDAMTEDRCESISICGDLIVQDLTADWQRLNAERRREILANLAYCFPV
jgi:hypothetical protein